MICETILACVCAVNSKSAGVSLEFTSSSLLLAVMERISGNALSLKLDVFAGSQPGHALFGMIQ